MESKNVRDAIAKLDFESLYGRVRFGDNGQIVMPQTVIQIQGSKIIEVFSAEFISPAIVPGSFLGQR